MASNSRDLLKLQAFNASALDNEKDIELLKFYQGFKYLQKISSGKIFLDEYDRFWYFGEEKKTYDRIEKEKADLFLKWDSLILLPDDVSFNKLKEIKGLASSEYNWYPSNIQFPAKITTKNGEIIDFSILIFSKEPPVQTYFKSIILLDEVGQIEASEFSLPYSFRLASTFCDEVRMGFSPFMVRTVDNKILTYDGITQFASDGEIKGNQFVEEIEFSWDNYNYKVSNVDFDKITFIIGKWDDRIEELFREYRKNQQVNNKALPIYTQKKSFWERIFRKKT